MNFFRANLMVCRVQRKIEEENIEAKKLRSFDFTLWYQILKITTQKSDVYKICQGKYKTDIAERLMCRGALPCYSEDSLKLCGLPRCYGDCAKNVSCIKCINLAKLYHSEDLEHEYWPEEIRIKYKSYYSDASGAGKEESDLHEHIEHPSIFMIYFKAMTRKYCYHIAKVT